MPQVIWYGGIHRCFDRSEATTTLNLLVNRRRNVSTNLAQISHPRLGKVALSSDSMMYGQMTLPSAERKMHVLLLLASGQNEHAHTEISDLKI